MTRAMWNGQVIAESDDVVVIDGYTYFPRDSVDPTVLTDSATTSRCIWKGKASYYTVTVDDAENRDAAWFYPRPSRAARSVQDRVAFWRGVKVEHDSAEQRRERHWFRRSATAIAGG